MGVQMVHRRTLLARSIARLAILTLVVIIGLPAIGLTQESISPPASPPLVSKIELSRDLSLWGMFANADSVVKGILVGLVIASLVTWTVWLAKTIELFIARREVRAAMVSLASGRTLAEVAQQIGDRNFALGEFIHAAKAELQLCDNSMSREGVKERIASRLGRIEDKRGRLMMRGTGVLATIGATAPFVGLFGTVWGIMNSFIGISKSQTTNLAVVAPGIAEALLATAFGLGAAIPAVVIYNVFSRQIGAYRAQRGDAAAELLRLVSRDLDRAATHSASPRAGSGNLDRTISGVSA